jgi:subtilisin family serine protease
MLRQVRQINLSRNAVLAAVVLLAAAGGTATGGPVAAAAPASGAIRNADLPGAIPGSYIVVLKNNAKTGVSRSATSAFAAADASLARRYDATAERSYTAALRGFSVRASAAAARRLAADPAVAYVEQNQRVQADDTQLNPTWGLDRVDQRNLPLSASYTYSPSGGQGVRAYVIDSGIRFTHQEFGGRAVQGVDLVDGGAADDCHGHGSHVAGTIGGAAHGIARAATLVAVRVLDCDGAGDVARVVAGVDWVTANAVKPAVVNVSIGYPSSSNPAALETAVTQSISTGLTYAISAGNDNGDACSKVPARVPTAITVAASEKSDSTWPSSNEGPCVDLFAPGLNVESAHYTGDTVIWNRSGTSMAAPHVAGAAALILGDDSTRTPQQVRDAIVAQATPGVLKWVTDGTVNLLLYVGA